VHGDGGRRNEPAIKTWRCDGGFSGEDGHGWSGKRTF
jgi:hypothetical protein